MASTHPKKKGILQRLSEGPVLGDGGFSHALEKRGYIRAGAWTPDSALAHPDAVKQLHREFLRSGSDVMQAFTFNASDNNLEYVSDKLNTKAKLTAKEINELACKLAKEVASEGDCLWAASLSEIPSYKQGKGKQYVQEQFRKQLEIYKHQEVDFVICEFFNCIEELEWAIEVAKDVQKPIAASMYIGPISDFKGVPTGECAVRMARAGADIIGLNCHYDPTIGLESMAIMKSALEENDLHPYLMMQPQGYWTPETRDKKSGSVLLPESPFAIDVRTLTRFEAAKYARDSFELGVRYIGGCCGFEPRHIRAMSEELEKERGKMCQATKELGHLADGLGGSLKTSQRQRASTEYWKNLVPTTGRPQSKALAVLPQDS